MATPASASTLCGPYQGLIKQLDEKYGETRAYAGLENESAVVEVFINPETQSWSAMRRYANGNGCLIAAGFHFGQAAAPSSETGEQH